jgi:hypothetical protein
MQERVDPATKRAIGKEPIAQGNAVDRLIRQKKMAIKICCECQPSWLAHFKQVPATLVDINQRD